jgi:hypothetical protein
LGEQASWDCTVSQVPVSVPFAEVNEQAACSLFPVQAAMASCGGVPPPLDWMLPEESEKTGVTAAEVPLGATAGWLDWAFAALPPEQAESSKVASTIRYRILVFMVSPFFDDRFFRFLVISGCR